MSLRTVFNHFPTMDQLSEAVGERIMAGVLPAFQAGRVEGDRAARVRELVRRRAGIFATIAPFRRRVSPIQRAGERIGTRLAGLDRALRALTRQALAPELERPDRDLAELVESVLSFEHWDRLRHGQQLGERRGARLLERAVLALLEDRPA